MASYNIGPCECCGAATLCECSGISSVFVELSGLEDDTTDPDELVTHSNLNGTYPCTEDVLIDEMGNSIEGCYCAGTEADPDDRGILIKDELVGGGARRRHYIWKICVSLACSGEGETLSITGFISLFRHVFDNDSYIGSFTGEGHFISGNTCFEASYTGPGSDWGLFGTSVTGIGYAA